MPTYKAPVEDVMFLLSDVFHVERYDNVPGFADLETIGAVLGEAGKFCEEVLAPLNKVGDKEGCKRNADGSVTTPTGFKDAYKKMAEGGWIGISADPEYGGQGLPHVVAATLNEFLSASNMAFGMYPGLSMGAFRSLALHGNDEQKKIYLPKLASGEWAGTMNLTEPQCGTDLGLIRTKAAPQADGSYKITGTKIFISAGEHDPHQEHRAPGAGAHRRRARGRQGHLAVRGAEAAAEARRLGRRARTRFRAARSKRRWASTATRPA